MSSISRKKRNTIKINDIFTVIFFGTGGIKMESFSWETFVNTGDIDAYLLYKSVAELKKDNELQCQTSEQKELS